MAAVIVCVGVVSIAAQSMWNDYMRYLAWRDVDLLNAQKGGDVMVQEKDRPQASELAEELDDLIIDLRAMVEANPDSPSAQQIADRIVMLEATATELKSWQTTPSS
jgi:hypothetical protein